MAMPQKTLVRDLGEIPIFRGLEPSHLAAIGELLRYKTFPGGTNLLTAEQPGETIYIILNGTIKVHIEQPDGSDVILAILGEGEIIGEMSAVDSLGRSASAVTLEETALYWMTRSAFQRCLDTHHVMNANLLRILSRRLRLANEHIEALAVLDVFGRIARQLLAFATEYGTPAPGGGVQIPIRLTQNDLGSLVGASRVRVNQVMSAYKQHGYLSVDQNHRITILNREALASRCY